MCCVLYGHLCYYYFMLSIYAFTHIDSLSPCLLLASLVIIFVFISQRMLFVCKTKQNKKLAFWKQSIFMANHIQSRALAFLFYSLFSPCYCFICRYAQIFSMVNVYIMLIHVHLHIHKRIVHLMQMVLLLFVLIMLKENVFVKHANIFIHLNILLHN